MKSYDDNDDVDPREKTDTKQQNPHSLLAGFSLSCCVRQNLYSNIFSKTTLFHEVQQTADLFHEDTSTSELHPCLASCLKQISYQHISSIQLFYFAFLAFSMVCYVQDSITFQKIRKLPSTIATETMQSVECFFVSFILILMTDVDYVF